MSGREWKPGDVVLAKYKEEQPKRFMRRRVFGRDAWEWVSNEGTRSDDLRSAEWVAPLVVIDPEDREQVKRLLVEFDYQQPIAAGALDDMQAALRAMTQPPRPPEPTGLGAVVEDDKGALWTRVTNKGAEDAWQPNNFRSDSGRREYADIAVVRVLSEGVDQ